MDDTGSSISAARKKANQLAALRRAERLKATDGRSYEVAHWTELSREARAAHNRLRKARGLEEIPPPLSTPHVPPRKPALRSFNINAPETIAAACDFTGVGEQATAWEGIARRLALMNAHRLLDKDARDLRTETLHRAIAKFVATAKKEAKYASGKPWSSGKIVKEAMRYFEVGKRTIYYAVANYPEDLHFVDKNGSKPVA